jgi:hypothetical protein
VDDHALLSWIDIGQNIATFLVAIGVAGEFLGTFLAGPARKRIDASHKAEMAHLVERTATAESQAATANAGVAAANERAATLEVEASRLNASAAEAMHLAEQERLARVELEERIAPRRLSADQRWAVAKACEPLRGQTVALISYGMDLESRLLTIQVKEALEAAGIKVRWVAVGIISDAPVGVHVKGPRALKHFVSALVLALSREGGLASGVAPAEVGQDSEDISVSVGLKPID